MSCCGVAGPFWDFTQVVAYGLSLSSQRFLEDALQNSGEVQVGGEKIVALLLG